MKLTRVKNLFVTGDIYYDSESTDKGFYVDGDLLVENDAIAFATEDTFKDATEKDVVVYGDLFVGGDIYLGKITVNSVEHKVQNFKL